jgi:hypothetical protein
VGAVWVHRYAAERCSQLPVRTSRLRSRIVNMTSAEVRSHLQFVRLCGFRCASNASGALECGAYASPNQCRSNRLLNGSRMHRAAGTQITASQST